MRVIQFSTGNVGQKSLEMIIGRPDLELVGLHAASPDKVGRDAADLCGLETPTGILATDDLEALVALKADCVVYMSQAESRPEASLRQVCAFLEAGTNVIATSFVWLVNPRTADAWLRDPIEAACKAGGSSMYVNGIDPGYSGDTLALAALSLVGHADSVRVQEIFDYGDYDDYEFTGRTFGFGTLPSEQPPLMFLPGVLSSIWGGSAHLIADAVGVELEEVREFYEPWVSPTPIDCAMTKVEPGEIAAVRFGVEGIVDGRPAIIVEHINRLTPASAPDWAYPPEGRLGVHRVVIEGSPGVEVNSHVGLGDIPETEAGLVATAARAVNAIEAVCQASPGLLGVVDLPAAYAGRVLR